MFPANVFDGLLSNEPTNQMISYNAKYSAMEGAKALVPSLKTAYKDVKKVISVKTTVSRPERRLPPIGTSAAHSSNAASSVLPPLSGTLPPLSQNVIQSSVLPPVIGNGTIPPIAKVMDNSSNSPGNARVDTGNGEEPLPTYGALYGPDTGSSNSAVESHTSAGANGTQSVLSRNNPFITSQLPAPSIQQPAMTPSSGSSADQPQSQAERIKMNGIRTWPTLAVCSVFICCPLFGLAAAMLTLSAENNFYDRHYIKAHKEAFMARICLLLAVVFGLITVIAVVSYAFLV